MIHYLSASRLKLNLTFLLQKNRILSSGFVKMVFRINLTIFATSFPFSLTAQTSVDHDYMSRAASVSRDDFKPGITWGETARLMADAMKRGRPEQLHGLLSGICPRAGLMSRTEPANVITWKNSQPG